MEDVGCGRGVLEHKSKAACSWRENQKYSLGIMTHRIIASHKHLRMVIISYLLPPPCGCDALPRLDPCHESHHTPPPIDTEPKAERKTANPPMDMKHHAMLEGRLALVSDERCHAVHRIQYHVLLDESRHNE